MTDETESGWHLDKRVPIALIVMIFVQTSGMIWWAATTSARVDELEKHFRSASMTLHELELELNAQGREDVKVAQQLANTAKALDRLAEDYKETNQLLRRYFATSHEPGP